jgi:hypothetical protein
MKLAKCLFFVLAIIIISSLEIIPPVKAQEQYWQAPCRFYPAWGDDRHPYVAGFVSNDNPLPPHENMTRPRALQVTVCFTEATSIPSNIESDNWVGSGIVTTGFDNQSSFPWTIDYGYSFVAYLNASGGPYFQIEVWKVYEWWNYIPGSKPPPRINLLSIGYYNSAISIGTDIKLMMQWGDDGKLYYWVKTYSLEKLVYIYTPNYGQSAYFAEGCYPKQGIPGFQDGGVVKYFQFVGAWSKYVPRCQGWKTILRSPCFMLPNENEWRRANFAFITEGDESFMDHYYGWGGTQYSGVCDLDCGSGFQFYPPDLVYFACNGSTTYSFRQMWSTGDWNPPSGGGGGGGDTCPTLLVWDGTGYMDYGILNIHNPSGEDVVREVPVRAEDISICKHKAVFRLREGWEGLHFAESLIDQVKLYALDSFGNRYLCPLTNAVHSRLGNVLPQLLRSDDLRVQTLLLETIDLEFNVPCQNAQGFVFVIEGFNMHKM